MQALEKIDTPDELLNRIQDRIIRVLNPLAKSRLLAGRLIEGVTIGTSETLIPHGLDQTGVKWMLVSPTVDARVWQSSSADRNFLYLRASASQVADIWVFT